MYIYDTERRGRNALFSLSPFMGEWRGRGPFRSFVSLSLAYDLRHELRQAGYKIFFNVIKQPSPQLVDSCTFDTTPILAPLLT